MMACSYLSAGGSKSEPTSTACWSPPAMTGCLAAETRPAPITLPTPPMTLPCEPIGLQSGLMGLPCESIGLPRASMALPRESTLPSGQLASSAPVGILNKPMPSGSMSLPCGVRIPSGQLGLSIRPATTAPMVPSNTQMVLPPPFARPLPMDLQCALSQTGSSAVEPALDLSTSTSSTPSLKSRLPRPEEDRE